MSMPRLLLGVIMLIAAIWIVTSSSSILLWLLAGVLFAAGLSQVGIAVRMRGTRGSGGGPGGSAR